MVTRALIAAGLLFAACSGLYDYEPASYVVRSGDTLYTIAWRYGLDHRDLAAWNGIGDPDRIYVGQRLALSPRARAAPPGGTVAASGGTAPAGASGAPATPARPAPPPARPAPAPLPEPAPAWQWPVRGPVVQGFGAAAGEITTGIGISGRVGQPIAAAAAGRVVYAGSGLIGYGQLVIIKHSETFLSAYGHNSRLLVVQGQDVARGQIIAEMGLGPGRAPRLHFEIRQNGDPVDPLRLLGG
jgi:lipoprotein NlpD